VERTFHVGATFGAHIFSFVLCLVRMLSMEQGKESVSGHMALDPTLLFISRPQIKLLLQATFPFHFMIHFITFGRP